MKYCLIKRNYGEWKDQNLDEDLSTLFIDMMKFIKYMYQVNNKSKPIEK